MTFLFWAAAIVVFAIAEAATTALVSIWFAVGAAAAMVASIFTRIAGRSVRRVCRGVRRNAGRYAAAAGKAPHHAPAAHYQRFAAYHRQPRHCSAGNPAGGYRPRACGWAGLAGPHGGRHSAAKRCTLRSKKRGRRGTDRIRCSRTGCGTARRTTALRQPAKVPHIV